MKADKFEVIVVDDCSIDNTLAILHNYAAKRKNLHVLNQAQNHRQGAARNRGLHEAKGEYVMFVDADDLVESGVPSAILLDQYSIPNNHNGMRCTSPTDVLSTAKKLLSMFRICLKVLPAPPTSNVYCRFTIKSPFADKETSCPADFN